MRGRKSVLEINTNLCSGFTQANESVGSKMLLGNERLQNDLDLGVFLTFVNASRNSAPEKVQFNASFSEQSLSDEVF